jgi:DNA-binding NtrC family response regulator
LLRLATSGEVWPIGAPPGRAGNPPAHSSVRLIGIADEDLTKTLEAGTFSRELVHRLAAVEISVPPVRDRADDIPVLFEQCLVDAGRVHSRPAPQLSADAEACARQYHWPGNIRELRRIAELLAKRSFGGRLSETDLRAALDPGSRPPGRDG